jgi:hypothetical protein
LQGNVFALRLAGRPNERKAIMAIDRYYVWVDNIAPELAIDSIPSAFASQGNDGWLPLAICDNEIHADAIADAIEAATHDLLDKLGMVIYRNPLSEFDDPSHVLLIGAKVKELYDWLDCHPQEVKGLFQTLPQITLAATARRLQDALPLAADGTASPAATTNDDRDKWIYDKCVENKEAYTTIISKLAGKQQWEPIESIPGIKNAANRYAKSHRLPLIPSRQPGRPPKK